MRAGKLRHRVKLQSQTRVSDGGGGGTLTWSDVAEIWADIDALSGTEEWRAQKDNPLLTHEIVIRYRPSVSTKHRIKFGSRIFDIESVRNKDERNYMLTLDCIEQVMVTA